MAQSGNFRFVFIAMITSVRGAKTLLSHNSQVSSITWILSGKKYSLVMLNKASFPLFFRYKILAALHLLFLLVRNVLDVFQVIQKYWFFLWMLEMDVCAPWTLLEEFDVWWFLGKSFCELVFECQTNCSDDNTANKQLEHFGTINGNVCLVWPFEDKRFSPCWAIDQAL